MLDCNGVPVYVKKTNSIGSVMVRVLASSPVDRGLEPHSGQAKDYKIVASPLSTQH